MKQAVSRSIPTATRDRVRGAAWIAMAILAIPGLAGCGQVAQGQAAPVSTSVDDRVTSPPTAGNPTTADLAPEPYDPGGYDPDPGRGFVPLTDPAFLPAGMAGNLEPDEYVLGVEWNGEARAYPVGMMAYHHIANDQVRGSPILITY